MQGLPAPGQVIDERYELLSLLGQGGMGAVYLARQVELGHNVAVKFLTVEDEDSLARFRREGQLLSKLQHGNIVICLGSGMWQEKLPYLVFECLAGETLRDKLDKEKTLPWRQCAQIASQVCAGLAVAHAAGIIHRDLKPDNIMLLEDQGRMQVKILDFGLAKISFGASIDVQRLTRTGALVGTVNYMSPEQCSGRTPDDRADIYALGCIMYEALSGRPPYSADHPMGVIYKHVSHDPEPLPDSLLLPQALQEIVFTCLAKDAGQRYQTATELQTDLELVLVGKGAGATTANRLSRRNLRVQVLTTAVIALAAVTLVAVFAMSDPGPAVFVERVVALCPAPAGYPAAPSLRLAASADWFLAQKRPRAAVLLYAAARQQPQQPPWDEQLRRVKNEALALLDCGDTGRAQLEIANALAEVANSNVRLETGDMANLRSLCGLAVATALQLPPPISRETANAVADLMKNPAISSDYLTHFRLRELTALVTCDKPNSFDVRQFYSMVSELEDHANYDELVKLVAYIARYDQDSDEHLLTAEILKRARLRQEGAGSAGASILVSALEHFLANPARPLKTRIKVAADVAQAIMRMDRAEECHAIALLFNRIGKRLVGADAPVLECISDQLQSKEALLKGKPDEALLIACRTYCQFADDVHLQGDVVFTVDVAAAALQAKELTLPPDRLHELERYVLKIIQVPHAPVIRPGDADVEMPMFIVAKKLIDANRWARARCFVTEGIAVTTPDQLTGWWYWLAPVISTRLDDVEARDLATFMHRSFKQKFGVANAGMSAWRELDQSGIEFVQNSLCVAGENMIRANRFDDAEIKLRQVLSSAKKRPDLPVISTSRALIDLYDIRIRRGQTDQAEAFLQWALKEDPAVKFWLAEYYRARGRDQLAVDLYRQVDMSELAKRNPETAKIMPAYVAKSLCKLGHLDEAEATLRAGIKKSAAEHGGEVTCQDLRLLRDLLNLLRRRNKDEEANGVAARIVVVGHKLYSQAVPEQQAELRKLGVQPPQQ